MTRSSSLESEAQDTALLPRAVWLEVLKHPNVSSYIITQQSSQSGLRQTLNYATSLTQ